MMVSVGRVASARSGRAARARLRARSRPAFFLGCSLLRAREEKNLEGSKKPYGRGAIAPGATFARARTCSSLVIRLDAIVNLRWLCEKRDSGGRGKPRLVCDRQLSSARETGVEAGGRRGFFFILGTIANSKNVTEEAARDFCVHGFHGFYSHANSQIFRLFRAPGGDAWTIETTGKRKKRTRANRRGNSGHSVSPRAHEVRKTRACRLFLDLSTDLSTFPPINRTHPPQQPRQKMKISAALIALFVALAANGASAQLASIESDKVFELHGSGTTNPQRFFWKVMDILEERAANPIKLTYRGVGACPRPVNPE